MCDQLGVVRQGYYRWRSTGPCARECTDTELTETIREIHTELHGHPACAGFSPRLVVRGVRVAAKRVWRLMRAAACADVTREPGRRPPSQVSDV
jgi:putative transposase